MRGYSGFTMIEVILALTIFSIGILGISGMLLIGEKGVSTGNKSLSAAHMAKSQMEQIKGKQIIEAGSGDCTSDKFSDILCQWAVRKDTPDAGMSEIEVRTSWNEGNKKRELILNMLRFMK